MSFRALSKLSLISLFIISPSVFADAAFDGLNTQIGIGFANLSSESQWGGNYKYGEKNVLGNISLGYSRQLNNQFNIAANVFYTFGSDKTGGAFKDGSPNYNSRFKTKNIWGLVIEPGYYFSEDSLGYFKLGYARTTSEYEDSGSQTDYGNSNGFLYGVGIKQMIHDHIYIGAETYQIDFSKSDNVYNSWWETNTNNTPSVTYGGITLGYNFGSSHKYEPRRINSSSAFNGLDVRLGLGFAEKSSESIWVNNADPYKVSDKGGLGNISVGYSQQLSNQFNIAANIFYTFGSDNAGQWSSSTYTWKIKDIWGISLEPGYYFNNNSLGYFKVGYARATSKYDHPPSSSADFGSSDGFLYGVGFKQLLTNKIYVGLETYQIDFSRNTVTSQAGAVISNKPYLTYGGFMLGYTF
jgi:hypothetical protein